MCTVFKTLAGVNQQFVRQASPPPTTPSSPRPQPWTGFAPRPQAAGEVEVTSNYDCKYFGLV